LKSKTDNLFFFFRETLTFFSCFEKATWKDALITLKSDQSRASSNFSNKSNFAISKDPSLSLRSADSFGNTKNEAEPPDKFATDFFLGSDNSRTFENTSFSNVRIFSFFCFLLGKEKNQKLPTSHCFCFRVFFLLTIERLQKQKFVKFVFFERVFLLWI
jgi:hypothetical protein